MQENISGMKINVVRYQSQYEVCKNFTPLRNLDFQQLVLSGDSAYCVSIPRVASCIEKSWTGVGRENSAKPCDESSGG